ncbi:hypothetical protein AHF37_10716 [Paragonimus kellicotti]|nr:hypothetical protein AHF37_10716 [Paragonimus kellicotti]
MNTWRNYHQTKRQAGFEVPDYMEMKNVLVTNILDLISWLLHNERQSPRVPLCKFKQYQCFNLSKHRTSVRVISECTFIYVSNSGTIT